MADDDVLGPIDYLAVEFPGGHVISERKSKPRAAAFGKGLKANGAVNFRLNSTPFSSLESQLP